MEIAAELYIIVIGLVATALLFVIVYNYYPLLEGQKQLETGPENIARKLADESMKCWERHRLGLDIRSEVCNSIDIRTSAVVSEEMFTKYLDCKKLPNALCGGKQCNCNSSLFSEQEQDKVRWLLENNETTIKIIYDANSRQISILDILAE